MGKASRSKRGRREHEVKREQAAKPEQVAPALWQKILLGLPVALVPIAMDAVGIIAPELAPFWWAIAGVALFLLWRSEDFLKPEKDYASLVGASAFGFYVFIVVICLSTETIASLDKRVRDLLDTNSIQIMHAQTGGVPGNSLSYYIAFRSNPTRPITIGIPKSDWEVLTIWQPAILSPEQTAWLDGMTDVELASFADEFQIATSTPYINVELHRLKPPSNDPQSGGRYLVGVSTSIPLASDQTTLINEIANVGRTGLKVESVLRQMYMNRR